jgi:hypothetical protein
MKTSCATLSLYHEKLGKTVMAGAKGMFACRKPSGWYRFLA